MEETLKRIKEYFATMTMGLRPINTLSKEYIAYTIRHEQEFGVAIEFNNQTNVNEESSSIRFTTRNFVIAGNDKSKKFLVLTCTDEAYRNEFAEFCTQFVIPGDHGSNRESLCDDPFSWWDHWVNLLGDLKSNRKCYDIIAELMALDKLYTEDPTITWASTHSGSHDIESLKNSYEIKSTVKKRDTSITISSQFQLDSNKHLELIFYRLEESKLGLSINDMVVKLTSHGYKKEKIESELNNKGFIYGSRLRDLKYKVLESRIYNVDESFPKITHESFKGNIFPKNVTKIMYTIDLEGIDYKNF